MHPQIARRSDTAGPADRSPGTLGLALVGAPPGSGADDEIVTTVRAGLDAGVTRLSTADFYGAGHHETILRAALRGRDRAQARISVSFGILCDPTGGFQGVDTRPAAVKSALAYTLRRLGTDYVDTYRPARLSPDVPVEDTVGAIAELVQAGYVRHIGLSDVDGDTLRRAAATHPISDLLVEYSVFSRGIEADLLPTARGLGIRANAYGVLPRGPLGGRPAGGRRGPAGAGAMSDLLAAVRGVAVRIGASVAQVAIAWALSRGSDIAALVSATRRDRLADALGALRLRLGAEELASIEAAAPGLEPPPATGGVGVRMLPVGSRPDTRAPRAGLASVEPRARLGAGQPNPVTGARARADTAPLTGREAQVLGLVAAGITNRAIASRLGISERTAREHVGRILLKLRVESRVEAAVLATEWRLDGDRSGALGYGNTA